MVWCVLAVGLLIHSALNVTRIPHAHPCPQLHTSTCNLPHQLHAPTAGLRTFRQVKGRLHTAQILLGRCSFDTPLVMDDCQCVLRDCRCCVWRCCVLRENVTWTCGRSSRRDVYKSSRYWFVFVPRLDLTHPPGHSLTAPPLFILSTVASTQKITPGMLAL
jgi:hypothetical protein